VEVNEAAEPTVLNAVQAIKAGWIGSGQPKDLSTARIFVNVDLGGPSALRVTQTSVSQQSSINKDLAKGSGKLTRPLRRKVCSVVLGKVCVEFISS